MFLNFKQNIQYSLNWKFLANLELYPPPQYAGNITNKNKKYIREIFSKISENNEFEYQSGALSKYSCLELQIGDDLYLFLDNEGSQHLEELLCFVAKAGSIDPVLNGTWFYVEEDFLFFICNGLDIVVDNITISDSLPVRYIYNNMFFANKEDDLWESSNHNDQAILRLCYDKWQTDTMSGKIYAMRNKIKLEKIIEADFEENSDKRVEVATLNEMRMLNKEFKVVKVLLVLIFVFIVVSRLFS